MDALCSHELPCSDCRTDLQKRSRHAAEQKRRRDRAGREEDGEVAAGQLRAGGRQQRDRQRCAQRQRAAHAAQHGDHHQAEVGQAFTRLRLAAPRPPREQQRPRHAQRKHREREQRHIAQQMPAAVAFDALQNLRHLQAQHHEHGAVQHQRHHAPHRKPVQPGGGAQMSVVEHSAAQAGRDDGEHTETPSLSPTRKAA